MRDLYSCFPIEKLGKLLYHLGCRKTRDRDAGMLKFSRCQYVQAVAEHFGIIRTSAIPSGAGRKAIFKTDGLQTGT